MKGQMWCGRASTLIGMFLLLLLLLAPHSHAGPVAKRDIDSLLEGKDKRPFCNAFTGCGRKRSDPGLESAASGAELDALAKHVLAEAKLWEQLQDKMEMMRSLAARLETHPLYRRKRSTAHSSPPARPHSTPSHKLEDEKQK